MAYYIAVYDWSLYTTPAGIPTSDLVGDTHANDPASPDYSPSATTWIGETFTYNGGASTLIEINDDDPDFEDGYVETGASQTLAADVTINGTTYPAGTVVQNEFAMLDAAGNEVWVVRIGSDNVGFTYPSGDGPTSGDTFTASVGRDGDPADSGDGVGSSEPYEAIVCFTPGVRIETPSGPRKVETLKVGDLVTTIDNGPKEIRWISRRQVVFQNGLEDAKPIEIKAGAFAQGHPNMDLAVSPQHRFVFQGKEPGSGGETLVAAKALTKLPGVREMKGKTHVEYIHFAFDHHEIVISNGLLAESCYLGPVFLSSIPKKRKPELKKIFPTIDFENLCGFGPTARPVVKVQKARNLLRAGKLKYDSEKCERSRLMASIRQLSNLDDELENEPDSSFGYRGMAEKSRIEETEQRPSVSPASSLLATLERWRKVRNHGMSPSFPDEPGTHRLTHMAQ